MGKITVLDAESANMIAAGEVVDRPASALKELLENSVDAHSKSITVDIKNGGNSRIRVTDDGDGILREDLPKTLYRHATSKIKNGYEINGVKTLGFRGEALAAASAVSRMEIITKNREEEMGSRLSSDETGVELYEAGCADGTTVIIDDLFYNVPARRKFMKKDSSEASACLAVCEKLALAYPDVSVSVFSDGIRKMHTSGDGKLFSVIYSLYGAQSAKSFAPVSYESNGIAVNGYISKPDCPRGNRSMQTFFINGRYIKSKTIQAALEEAFKSYIASGKFPAAILNISINYDDIDVNVHPAKTEIKFADEKQVFSAVYYGVKSTLEHKDVPDNTEKTVSQPSSASVSSVYIQHKREDGPSDFTSRAVRVIFKPTSADDELNPIARNNSSEVEVNSPDKEETPFVADECKQPEVQTIIEKPLFKLIGEAYNTFIFVQLDDKIIIVDKHAAHERILYERLKDKKQLSVQTLLFPVTVTLSPSQADILLENKDYLLSFGFGIEGFGPSTVAVREVPGAIKGLEGLSQILEGFAKDITDSGIVPFEEKVDKALYTVACKSAVKARQLTSYDDDEYIITNILQMGLKYCPHGRPFIKEISKRELERYFDR